MASRLMLLVGLMVLLPGQMAQAASAVAYGARAVQEVYEVETELQAVQQALEGCSLKDRACKLLTMCARTGFGAVASALNANLIVSVGAACARPSAKTAKDDALALCAQNAGGATCRIRAEWVDQ